jgi:hypothetical protein
MRYLGRDGGGTKSGAGSPLGSDDDDSIDTSIQAEAVAASFESSKGKFSSFDDPNRVLADALGDQSDAEVEEADLEVGTKAREDKEMELILEEERRERSQSIVRS